MLCSHHNSFQRPEMITRALKIIPPVNNAQIMLKCHYDRRNTLKNIATLIRAFLNVVRVQ